MNVYVPGSAYKSPDGTTNRISAPLRLNDGLMVLPVMSCRSSMRNSMLLMMVWGSRPTWLPFM